MIKCLTSISPSGDDVGDALSTQKETNYAIHAESPNRDPEESHTRCRVKIQNTDRGRGRSKGEKVSLKSGMKRCTGGRSTKSERKMYIMYYIVLYYIIILCSIICM